MKQMNELTLDDVIASLTEAYRKAVKLATIQNKNIDLQKLTDAHDKAIKVFKDAVNENE